MTPTPLTDLLVSVIGAEAHASAPRKGARTGGEWDAWNHLPRRTRKRLIGSGYCRRRGMAPDVFATMIADRRGTDDYRDCLDWFYRLAPLAIRERRTAAQRDARAALARRNGQRSYFALRNARAVALGYRSFWHQRKSLAAGETPPNVIPIHHNHTDKDTPMDTYQPGHKTPISDRLAALAALDAPVELTDYEDTDETPPPDTDERVA